MHLTSHPLIDAQDDAPLPTLLSLKSLQRSMRRASGQYAAHAARELGGFVHTAVHALHADRGRDVSGIPSEPYPSFSETVGQHSFKVYEVRPA